MLAGLHQLLPMRMAALLILPTVGLARTLSVALNGHTGAASLTVVRVDRPIHATDRSIHRRAEARVRARAFPMACDWRRIAIRHALIAVCVSIDTTHRGVLLSAGARLITRALPCARDGDIGASRRAVVAVCPTVVTANRTIVGSADARRVCKSTHMEL